MKLQLFSEIALHKPQTLKKSPNLIIPITALAFILTIILIKLPFPHNISSLVWPEARERQSPGPAQTDVTIGNVSKPEATNNEGCDLFTGEWVPNPEGPYYTNETCDTIQEEQNCMKYGRPDLGYMKWRWKPDDCELPVFDPHKFLEVVKGKSLAFVGDSVARNHMQSLICLLSRVARPIEVPTPKVEKRLFLYTQHNFNISIFFTPYLIRTVRSDPNDITRPFHLFLDEYDESWTAEIDTFDYIIVSAGPWFYRPTYFHLSRTLIGCLLCPEPNVTHITQYFSYRWAFRTALKAIENAVNFNGVAFVRTLALSHFEGGSWDKGGDCVRTRPYRRNETELAYYEMVMHEMQLEEMASGGKLRLFDATKVMLLRPDGHPGRYGRWQVANRTVANDCVHWCLPGPIDAWNDLLQELFIRESVK